MSEVPADKINILLAVKSAQRPQRRAAFSLALPLFLFLLLDRQQYFDIDHLIEMSHDTIQFVRHIISQGRSHF